MILIKLTSLLGQSREEQGLEHCFLRKKQNKLNENRKQMKEKCKSFYKYLQDVTCVITQVDSNIYDCSIKCWIWMQGWIET